MANKELNTLTPKKWVANLAGAAPTLDVSDGIVRADIAIDSSTTPNKIWRCLDATEGAPIWHEIDFMNPTGFGTSVPLDLVHLKGSDETPDPTTDITHNNVYLESPTDGDAGVYIGDEVTGPVWYMQNYRGEKSEYWYLWNQLSGANPMVANTGGRIGFNNPMNIMDYHAWYVNPATGLLDDLEVGGLYTSRNSAQYEVSITDAVSNPNKFKWRRSDDDGTTWGALSAEIAVTGAAQVIERGITVTIETLTGHNTNDIWRFQAHSQLPNGSHTVHPSKIDEIITTDNYVDPVGDPVYIDITGSMNWTQAASRDVPGIGTKSALYVGCKSDFNSLYFVIDTPSAGMTMKVQYWNGAWTDMTAVTHSYSDGTANLTTTGRIRWEKQNMTDWVKTIPTGKGASYNLHWVRIVSTTEITTAPTVATIVRHGSARLAVFTSHLDTIPCFKVDALGRTGIGTDSVTGNNQLQVVYPYGTRPSLAGLNSIAEIDSDNSSRAELINRLSQSSATGASGIVLAKSRGNLVTPSNLVNGDTVGKYNFKGYVDSAWKALGGTFLTYLGDGTTTYADMLFKLANNGTEIETAMKLTRNSSTGNGILQMMNNTTAIGAGIEEFSIDGTMAGNSDLAVPTEKAVKTYVDRLSTYGEMYQQGNTNVTTIGSTAWIQVTNFSTGLVNGITYATSALTVGTTGIYKVVVSLSGAQLNNADVLEFSLAINGSAGTYAAQPKIYALAKTNSTNARYAVSMSGILSLTATNVLRLIVRNTAANRDTTVNHANVSLQRIA